MKRYRQHPKPAKTSRNALARQLQAVVQINDDLGKKFQSQSQLAIKNSFRAAAAEDKVRELEARLKELTDPILRYARYIKHMPTELDKQQQVWRFEGAFRLGIAVDLGCLMMPAHQGSAEAYRKEIARRLAADTYEHALQSLRVTI